MAVRRLLAVVAAMLFCALSAAPAQAFPLVDWQAPAHKFNFGDVPFGTSGTTQGRVRNEGNTPLVVQPPIFSNSQFSAPDFGSGAVTIQAGDTYTFTVRFTPTIAGVQETQMFLLTNANNDFILMSGRGSGPILRADPVAFGQQFFGETALENGSVSNFGDPVTIESVVIEEGATGLGEGDFRLVAPSGPQNAVSGVLYQFAFTPSGAGKRSAVARLIGSDGTTLLRIPLSGEGFGPGMRVADSLHLGTVRTGHSVSRKITIFSVGDSPLYTTVNKVGSGAFTVAGDSAAPIPPGSSRTLTVTFSPTSTGLLTGTLEIQQVSGPLVPVALTGTGSSTVPLAPFTALTTGGATPTDVETGDFDEDSDTDALVGFAASGDVQLALGLGDGEFAAPANVGGAGSPGAMDFAVGDVDVDGHLDVVAVSPSGTRILLGAGDGTFTVRNFALNADGVALADFDDDGDLDLVATLSSSIQLRRFAGAGDGTFTSLPNTGLPGVGTGVTVSDLQRDGDMDFVATYVLSDGTKGARTGVNLGDGSFGGNFFTPESGGVAVGQFDGGLLPDVSFGSKLLLNLAAPLVAGGVAGDVVQVADFDGDRRDDQVTAREGEPFVNLSLGDGSGGLQPSSDLGTDAPDGTEPADLAVADLNGDGRPDVLGALGGEQVSVLLNASSPSGTGAGKALITEARFGGDGYVQVMNTSRTDDLSLDGWQLWFGGAPFRFPAGTRLAPRGTTLVTSPVRGAATTWSLASQVRGLVGVLPAASGVQLIDRSGVAVDAVGLTSAPAGLREGTGVPEVSFRGQGAYVRKSVAGSWVDTQQNEADFRVLDTAAQAGDVAALGSPRPDTPFDPTNRNDILQSSLIDPSKPASAAPNRQVVDGKLVIRRVLTNCSGGLTTGACLNADPNAPAVAVKRVRFRITDLSTVGTSTGAILKAVSFGSAGGYTQGITLGAPSASTGGGINATLTPRTSALLGAGLLPGSSFEVEFAFTVERGGSFRFGYDTEDDLEVLPKPVASPAAEEKVPEAKPVPEVMVGTAPAAPASASSAPVAPSAAAQVPQAGTAAKSAASKKKAKCVTRAQRRKLKGSARKRAVLCKAKTVTSKPASKKKPTSTSTAKGTR